MSSPAILSLPLFVCLASAGTAAACYDPTVPYCASEYGRFDDEDDFRRCRTEMESYQSDVETFVSCQKSEIQRLQSEADDLMTEANRAVDEHSEAVEAFNRRARQ